MKLISFIINVYTVNLVIKTPGITSVGKKVSSGAFKAAQC
jgi:hypothetical protein